MSSKDENEKPKEEKENKKLKEENQNENENENEDDDYDYKNEEEDDIMTQEGINPYNDYDDKELKPKNFKVELADMSNEIDEKLFEQIFGHKLIKLADKLINTTDKEENQIIIKNIEKK